MPYLEDSTTATLQAPQGSGKVISPAALAVMRRRAAAYHLGRGNRAPTRDDYDANCDRPVMRRRAAAYHRDHRGRGNRAPTRDDGDANCDDLEDR